MKKMISTALICILLFSSCGNGSNYNSSVYSKIPIASSQPEISSTIGTMENSTLENNIYESYFSTWNSLSKKEKQKLTDMAEKFIENLNPPYFSGIRYNGGNFEYPYTLPSSSEGYDEYYGVIENTNQISNYYKMRTTLNILYSFQKDLNNTTSGGAYIEQNNVFYFGVDANLMEKRINQYFGIPNVVLEEELQEGFYLLNLESELPVQNLKLHSITQQESGILEISVKLYSNMDGLQTKELYTLNYYFTLNMDDELSEYYLQLQFSEYASDKYPNEEDKYYEPN